jgi:6-phosphogluconolactonase
MSELETVITKDREDLVATASQMISFRLFSFSKEDREIHIAITGGTVGILVLEAIGVLVKNEDLSKLHIWWVDERFVSEQSSDRNELQARTAWLSDSSIKEQNIHPFPAEESGSIDDAAKSFANQIEKYSPSFDLVLLGMGEDGHVASLFPGSKGIEVGTWVVIEKESPKPPPQRLSLSRQAINGAKEVVFLVSGAEKAGAVRDALSGVGNLPASTVSGTDRTIWLIDEAAASEITSS